MHYLVRSSTFLKCPTVPGMQMVHQHDFLIHLMCSPDVGTGKEVIPNSCLALEHSCMGWKDRGGTEVKVAEI